MYGSSNSDSGNEKVRNLHQILAALIAYLGLLSFGFDIGYSSPAIPDLQMTFKLSFAEASWFGSLVTIGAAIGAVISGLFIEIFGRKSTLLMANIPQAVGYGIIAGVDSLAWLYVGRTLTGLSMGMMNVVVSVYIAETLTVKLRGILGTAASIFVGSGMSITYLLGIPLSYKGIALIGASIATIMAILVLFIPETPRWYMKKGKNVAATEALQWLRGPQANIEEELKEIELNIANQPEKFDYSDMLATRYIKPLLLGLMVHVLQKLLGMTVIGFYTESIFQSVGFKDNADTPSVITSLVYTFGCLPSMFLVNKLGRKAMLVASASITGISCLAVGLFYYLYEEKHIANLSWLPIISLIIYNFGYALGWGNVPWLVASEIFPLRIRGFASGLASVVSWILGFLLSKEFPVLVEATSYYVGFWLFGGMSALSIVLVIFLLPETKGKSLEEIEDYFASSSDKKYIK